MSKKHPKNWARVDNDLWRQFKSIVARKGGKIYEEQEEALRLYIKKEAKNVKEVS